MQPKRFLRFPSCVVLVGFLATPALLEAEASEGSNDVDYVMGCIAGAGGMSPKKRALEEMAKKGAERYECPETRKEGLAILRKAANAGSPFALARLSALYYLGEGGVRQDYDKALRLMKSAVSKGFPASQLPIKEAETACKRAKESKAKVSVQPGDGYPGILDPYSVNRNLKHQLDRFNLKAGWFRRDTHAESMLNPQEKERLLANEIPYLLFTPKRGTKPVPLLVYFGGTGEQGTDLLAHFNQTTIFSKITSTEFQEKHPCYLFAPMVPKGASVRCSKAWSPPMADLVCDAMYAVIRAATNPRVDTNRLYLTGLSYGGSAAWTFSFGYPGRFAASLPVAGFCEAFAVPDEKPGSIWLLYNESEFKSEDDRRALADVAHAVKERGGEFRMSSFPDIGHNAWDKAWREDSVWEWMFSKNACGRAAGKYSKSSNGTTSGGGRISLNGAGCSASKPGSDSGTGPERVIDGLDATCYVSAEPFRRGDWWQVEFAQPVSGRITVKSGRRDGTGRMVSARVETSANGRRWLTAGRFRHDNGECTFVPRIPVKFLRVVSDSQKGETFILREVVVL